MKEIEIKERLLSMRIPLCSLPSPCEKIGPIWVKRDDILGDYGGNKVRKIEFLYRSVKSKELVLFGPAGSHHVLANAIYGKKFGYKIYSFLFKTQLMKEGYDHVVKNMEIIKKLSDKFFIGNLPTSFLLSKIFSIGKYFVPLGSTSPISTLGFVLAGIELSEDVKSGRTDEPDYIFVPLGTMGTAAGLSIGITIAGLKSKIIAVRVVEKFITTKKRLKKLISESIKILGIDLDPNIPMSKIKIVDGFIGRGYGFRTLDGEIAQRFFSKFGIKSELTYTAKTLSAILNLKLEGIKLYWNTLNSRETYCKM